MNKLFTKIAKLGLGLAMAAGVGVAVSDNKVISAAHAADTFEKVTSFSVGDQIIFVNESKKYEMSSGAGSNASSYTTSPAGTYVMTVEAGNGGTGYSFKNGSNYISWSSGNNLATSTTKNNASSWTISTSTNGNFKLANVGTTSRILQFNSSSPKFAPYTSSQTAFQIYKKVSAKTLSSISVSGATTSFDVDDTFSFGGTVTAHYSDSTTANVTSSATFSGYNMSTAGEYTVTASYTEGSVTKTATYSITVAAHTHTYSNAWSSDDTHHWHAATCGHDVKDSYAEHTFGAWVTDTEASCTTDGSKHHVCSVCGKSVSETIPATGHTYVNHICSVCGAEEVLEVTFEYPGGSTTNMTGGNDAATLGQSTNDWSAVGNKGGNTNYPGLNTNGEIRLYGSSQNYLVIKTLAETGTRYLTSVVIASSQKNFAVYAGEANFTTAIASSTDSSPYTYTLGANVSAFTIRNESSTQSKIQSITVTYSDQEATTYTVSFNGNGASGNMEDVEEVLGSYTLPANGFTVPSGKRFAGWKAGDSEGYSGETILPEATYAVEADVTFWAQWVDVSTVSFNGNGASGSMASVTVDTNTSYTLPGNGFTVPTGKAFAGWKVGNVGDTLAAGANYTVSASSITLYAQWSDIYTVSFNGNGASGSMSSVTSGSNYTLPANEFTVPSGKQFAGWKVENAGETLSAGSSYTLEDDVTLYAQWEDKQNLGGIVSGEKYFIIANGYYLTAFNNAPPAAAGTAVAWPGDDNMPAEDTNTWTFTTTGSDDDWIITSQAGNTLYSTATNNGLGCTSSGSDHWTVIDSGENGLKLKSSISRYLTLYSTGTNFRVYTSTTGQTEADSTIRFVKYVEPVTLDSLTVSGATATFTAGDYFSLGSPTITATYSTGAEPIAANDSGLSFKLSGNAITTSTRLTSSDNGKSLVVRYTDSENRYADATGYTLTVNPKPVESVTLDKASATFAKGGSVQLTATVSDEYAIQTVKWTTSDSSIATVSAATSTSGNAITVTGSSSNAGSATITAYVDENDNGSLDSGEKSATCAITVSGDPVLNMLDDEENIITGESLHAFTTDSNIYLHVDAQNFVGAITYTWSSSNTSAIAIKEEADEMCEFDIVGAGTNVRLSCHAVGATSGNLTTYVDYTVAEPQVDEVTWSAPATLNVYDNASLTAANITSWSPAYHKDNGESGSISSGYAVKLGGSTISLSHSWDIEDDGEELWIEYGGVASSHVTVNVAEHLNQITYSSWSLVTDVSDLSAGDVIIIANASKGKAMASTALKAGETLETTDVTITDGVVTSEIPSGTARFTLGGNSSDGWSFKCGDEYLYFSTTTNNRTMALKSDSSVYDISIDGETGDAIIGDTMRVVLNTNNNPARWSSYNTTTETASMQFAEIYKATNSNIADTNFNAQKALLGFVNTFNSTLSCNDGGDTANIASKWSTASSAFTTAMNSLSDGDKIVFKRLVANASSVEGGDSLQDMLARYDYIIAKYKLDNDFLHSSADRAEVAKSALVSPLVNIIGENTNTVAIIVIISMVSVTAIGGYFFLRKKKEQ